MAFSINHITLVGNVTQEPELKYTPSGAAVCTFSMATNRGVKGSDGQWSDVATFHRVVVWQKLAEFVSNNLSKGDPVAVEGRQEHRQYKTQAGENRYMSEVAANTVIPFARRPKGEVRQAGDPATPEEATAIFTGGGVTSPDPLPPVKDPTDDWPQSSPAAKPAPSTVKGEEVNPDDIPF